MCIKRGPATSCVFTVSSGVRQGVYELSLRLFALYVDDLSTKVNGTKSACFIKQQLVNDVMYTWLL